MSQNILTESKIVVATGWQEQKWKLSFNGYTILAWEEKVLEMDGGHQLHNNVNLNYICL